jgi:type III pantothenate kinase
MSETNMPSGVTLAIDIGNTRAKWGVFDAAGELQAHGVVATDALTGLQVSPAWAACKRAVISNVAGDQAKAALIRTLATMDVHFIISTVAACGVKNRYRHPAQLGTDRWAAVIAAWHHYHEPCIVVSAGTAVTIDALGRDTETGGGEFLGGYILPGLRLMQQSIIDKAPGVQAIDGRFQDYPDNTADALYTGSLNAIAGAVRTLSARLGRDQQVLPRVVIAGGDAEAIHELLAQDAALANRLAIADNLVLQGLLILESEIR